MLLRLPRLFCVSSHIYLFISYDNGLKFSGSLITDHNNKVTFFIFVNVF